MKHTKLDLFADDATMHDSAAHVTPIENNLRKDMENVQTWCEENKMKINELKTKCMIL